MKKWLKRILAAVAILLAWNTWGTPISHEQAEPIIGIIPCTGSNCPKPSPTNLFENRYIFGK